jgi:hypothetical protein
MAEQLNQSMQWLMSTTDEKHAFSMIKKYLLEIDKMTTILIFQQNTSGLIALSDHMKKLIDTMKQLYG